MRNLNRTGCRLSSHDHSPDNHDGHAPKDFGFAFAVGIGLNFAFVLLEAFYGFIANSVALLADAGHNLSDVLGLAMAWGASALVKRAPTPRFTYGFGSSTILAALANAVFLLVATGAIIWEALQRFNTPEVVASKTVMIVAAIGIAVNGFTAWMFMSGSKDDINIRGAYLHMAADAAIAFGVVLAGFAMLATGWPWIDPLASIVISVIIIYGTWGLLRESATLAMHAVPPAIEPARVAGVLEKLPGVSAIHDLHIWPISTTKTALTCHLVMPGGQPNDAFLTDAAHMLEDKFGIHHATLQVERAGCAGCSLETSASAGIKH